MVVVVVCWLPPRPMDPVPVEGVERQVSSSSPAEVCLQIKRSVKAEHEWWGALTGVCLLIAIFRSASRGIVTREDQGGPSHLSGISRVIFLPNSRSGHSPAEWNEYFPLHSRAQTEFCPALLS